jgi:hypothetical protein
VPAAENVHLNMVGHAVPCVDDTAQAGRAFITNNASARSTILLTSRSPFKQAVSFEPIADNGC